MKVALAVLSIAAVLFLLRVLVALVTEWVRLPPPAARVYLAKFHPSKGRGGLIVMNLEGQRRERLSGDDERMAV